MKLITNKNIKRKILIAILIIIVASFIFPVKAQASLGGKLLQPVIDLTLGLGDGAFSLVHNSIMDQEVALYRIDLDDSIWEKVWTTLVAIAVAAAAVGIFIGTGGLGGLVATGGFAAFVGIGKVALKAVVLGSVAGYIFNSEFFGNEIVLPLYSVSPETIFSGKIPMFNVDFFNTEWDIVNNSGNRNCNFL